MVSSAFRQEDGDSLRGRDSDAPHFWVEGPATQGRVQNEAADGRQTTQDRLPEEVADHLLRQNPGSTHTKINTL